MAQKRRPRGPKTNVQKATQYMPAKVVAQKALTSVRRLRRQVGPPEIKFFDLDTASMFTSSGSTTSLCGIAAGDAVNERTGNQIIGKRLLFRALMEINASATDSALRLIIGYDKENVGSNPAVTDVLASSEVTGMYEQKNNKGRFKILYDKVHIVNAAASGLKMIKALIPLKNLKIEYSGTSAANRRKNSLFLLGIGTEAANYPQLYWNSRLEYLDD